MRRGGKLWGRGHEEPATPTQMSWAPEAGRHGPSPLPSAGHCVVGGLSPSFPWSPGHTLHSLSSATCWVWSGVWRGLCPGLPAVCARVWVRGPGLSLPPARMWHFGILLLVECLGQDKTLENSLIQNSGGSHDPHGGREQGDPLQFREGILERVTFRLGHTGPDEQRAPGILRGRLESLLGFVLQVCASVQLWSLYPFNLNQVWEAQLRPWKVTEVSGCAVSPLWLLGPRPPGLWELC